MKVNYLKIFRYIAFFVTSTFLILAFNVYMENYRLEKEIENIKEEIRIYEIKKNYYKNFLIPFLNSKIGKIVFFHKSSIPLTGENIVIIQDSIKGQNIKSFRRKEINNVTLWYTFLKEKVINVIDLVK